MSEAGDRILRSVEQARAFARDETIEGFSVTNMNKIGAGHRLKTNTLVPHRKRASIRLNTKPNMPASDYIEPTAKPVRRRRAKDIMKTIHYVPSVDPIAGHQSYDNHMMHASSGEGHRDFDSHEAHALAATVSEIVELQKQRIFCIKSQSRADRSCEAFIARYLGYRGDLDEKERKALFARAGTLRRAVEKGGRINDGSHDSNAPDADGQGISDNHMSDAASVCTPIIINSATSRIAWDNHRRNVEKRMEALARSLPAHAWAKGVAGFGNLGLAIIVGEVGNQGAPTLPGLSNYATKERVWKRLGLAVISGERQQKRTNIEQALEHGYNPRRRAEIWTIADSMFKHQWHGAKDNEPAGPAGPYGVVYARRKAHTEGREWSLARRDKDARRIMTKALTEDLWRVWRGLPPLEGNGAAQYE